MFSETKSMESADTRSLCLRYQCMEDTDVWFRVKTSTRLDTIFNHYSHRAGVDRHNLRFILHGDRVWTWGDLPEDLDEPLDVFLGLPSTPGAEALISENLRRRNQKDATPDPKRVRLSTSGGSGGNGGSGGSGGSGGIGGSGGSGGSGGAGGSSSIDSSTVGDSAGIAQSSAAPNMSALQAEVVQLKATNDRQQDENKKLKDEIAAFKAAQPVPVDLSADASDDDESAAISGGEKTSSSSYSLPSSSSAARSSGLATIIDFANRYKVKVEDAEGKQAALTDELEDAQDLNECLVRSENNKMTEIDKLRVEVERLRKENERLKEGRGGSA
jgi:hypothetical protein